MRLPRVFSFGLAALAAPLLADTTPPAAAPATPEVQEVPAAKWIADLSSSDFAVREEATRQLWKLGDDVLEPLQQALEGEDPEAAFRAAELIRNIEHAITPETNPEIIRLIERYKRSRPQEKHDIMTEIQRLKGWRQMLKLYSTETDPVLREEMALGARFAATIGAREQILKDNLAEARKLLEMAPRDAQSLMALASFCRGTGILDAEIERAADGPADWRAALARAKGDPLAAAEAATEAKDVILAGAMRIFTGDPLPWLDLWKERATNDQARALYIDIVTARWTGKEKATDPKALAPVLRLIMDAPDQATRMAAAQQLFLLGEPSIAESTLLKSSANEAAQYYSSLDRFPDAIAALGLNPKTPDYKTWAEEKFALYLDPKRQDDDAIQRRSTEAFEEIIRLAAVLDTFGFESELTSAYEPLLLKLADTEENEFHSILNSLMNIGSLNVSVALTRNVGVKWADGDEGRWRQLVGTVTDEHETALEWWDWMPRLDPQSSAIERFDGLLAVTGMSDDPTGIRAKWLDLGWKAVAKQKEAQRSAFVKRLAFASDLSQLQGPNGEQGRHGDAANSVRVFALLSDDEKIDLYPNAIIFGPTVYELSAADRWEELADFIRLAMKHGDDEDNPTGKIYLHAWLAGALRKAGNEKDATWHDAMAEKLALGDWYTALRISEGYSTCGDRERAELWLTRAMLEAPPQLNEYRRYLNNFSDHLIGKGRWKEAAAVAEAAAVTHSGLQGSARLGDIQLLDLRLRADLARALSILSEDKPRAVAMLERCHGFFPGSGFLADTFFPSLRKVGLIKEHDKFFETSWAINTKLTTEYPKSHRLRNGAAWLGSRANRRLDEAEKHAAEALRLSPDQAAYLDTMGEVLFAKGDRRGALKVSSRAVNSNPMDSMIRAQHERFAKDPPPSD